MSGMVGNTVRGDEIIDVQDGLTLLAGVIRNDFYTGKAGGLTVKGDTASGGDLTLTSTAHATKGKIYLGSAHTSYFNESNGDLVISRHLTAVNGVFSGAVSGTTGTFSSHVVGVNGTFSGAVSGTTGTFSSTVSGVAGTFSGAVSGTTGTFSSTVSGVAGTFSGAVSGTTGTFSSTVSGVDGTFSGAVSGTTGTFSSTGTFTGNVGIGAAASTGNLHVSGATDRQIYVQATNTDAFSMVSVANTGAGGHQLNLTAYGTAVATTQFGVSRADMGTLTGNISILAIGPTLSGGILILGIQTSEIVRITAAGVHGGAASGGNLTIASTTHATKGKVKFGVAGTSAYDEVNERWGVGTSSPGAKMHLLGATTCGQTIESSSAASGNAFVELTLPGPLRCTMQMLGSSLGATTWGVTSNGQSYFSSTGADLFVGTTHATGNTYFGAGAANSSNSTLRIQVGAKMGFWGIAPVVQYTTTGTATGFTGGGGTTATHLSTFTGNTGSTAYTTGDIVRALKLCGVMLA